MKDQPPLPGFVIVGAQKAGTTSLSANLRRHPQIFMPATEVHFFDRNWAKGTDWYRSQFSRGEGKLCGEKTPRYLTQRTYMKRLHQVLPHAKIIVLLRDPVARLFSHINHRIQQGGLPKTLQIDEAYLRNHLLSSEQRVANYVGRGRYHDQLQANVFPLFPRNLVFIRATDRWASSIDRSSLTPKDAVSFRGADRSAYTRHLMHELQEFLGIGRWDPPEYVASHVRTYAAPVTDGAKVLAAQIYEQSNHDLFKLLGYEIPEWSYEGLGLGGARSS